MKKLFTLLLALALIPFINGCRSSRRSETSELSGEMSREMAVQMQTVRAQMVAAGASAQQLREFDRAMAQLKKNMGQMERTMELQMRALEARQ